MVSVIKLIHPLVFLSYKKKQQQYTLGTKQKLYQLVQKSVINFALGKADKEVNKNDYFFRYECLIY